MGRWSQGAQEVEQLLARRHLEKVKGARADGTPWLDKARRRLETAEAIVVDDPESARWLAARGIRVIELWIGAEQRHSEFGSQMLCGTSSTSPPWLPRPPGPDDQDHDRPPCGAWT